MIKAIIFDFDGTIIDTETAWYYAFRDAYKNQGAELTLETYSQCIGTSTKSFNPYEYINTLLNQPIDLQQFGESVRKGHDLLMAKEQIRPGISDYLLRAKKEGLKIGLATSSEYPWVEKYLGPLGISEYFECIRTSDDVKLVKPDPELYLQCLDCLGVKADEAIAIEDSPNGARAAVAAGMHCVVIPNTITKSLDFGLSHFTVGSLAELDFEQLLSGTYINFSKSG